MRGDSASVAARATLVVVLVLIAAWPAFNNGFVEDDFVLLERASTLEGDPLYLLSIPPEWFRSTTYTTFLVLEQLFGYRAQAFYAFAVLLHLINLLLLYRLVVGLTGKSCVALLVAILFATFQDPQEAVMWLAAMNELWLGFFLLAALLLWRQGRYLSSSLCYCAALLSKESAPMLLLLVVAVELWQKRSLRVRTLLFLLLPTVVALLVLRATASSNSLLQAGYYSFSFQALWVWFRTLIRLAFPWLFLALTVSFVRGRWPGRNEGVLLLWIGGALAPYCFLTYQDHLPSRQLYVASMGVAFLLALLMAGWSSPRLAKLFLAVFVVGNLSYLWLVKDAQYEDRAAPTSQLIKVLRSKRPACISVRNFPGNPWTGKLTARLVPGWKPELLLVGEAGASCRPESTLDWDPDRRVYEESVSQVPR